MQWLFEVLFIITACSAGVTCTKCGQTTSTGARIVGGRNASPGEFPWQVSIQMKNDGFHFCGGSIIAPDVVVTAAHCMQRQAVSFHYFNVAQVKVHESYEPVANDIALIKLTEPFDLAASNGFIGSVCLPTKNYEIRGNVDVTGWGSIYPEGDASPVLLDVTVPVLPDLMCSMGTFGSYEKESMICAGVPTRDSCQGDSGGPAVQRQNGSFVLAGIVSYGYSCGIFPGVYTRVASYVDWINRNVALLKSS
ncbi:trypsin-1-like [Ornithodoros turicata]|uniref:trypsin-1-like n=1 Tax=Ornithodoros turicata TaxID=34597 RepID=UPI00313941B8